MTVTFEKVDHPYPHYKFPDLRAYLILVDEETIGRVYSVREESWEKSGRIRMRYLGAAKSWEAGPIGWDPRYGLHGTTYTGYSRQAAVELLVSEWREVTGL